MNARIAMLALFVAGWPGVGCGPGPTCTGGQVACDDACVDLALDPGHCGACGRSCATDELCSVATCATTCLAGLSECNGRCVDLDADGDHCGSCGHACGGDDVCAAGTCSTTCGALDRCGDHCADVQTDNHDCGACGTTCPQGQFCAAGACTASEIQHVVIIVEENHTFDNYFGQYCTAAAGSNPTCTTGRACCEAVPATEPSGAAPIALTDLANQLGDRDHERACELAQVHGGAMDHYVVGSNVPIDPIVGLYTYACSNPNNFAVADATTMQTYWSYADQGALADRYFQPTIGSTSANDMYFATAQWEFDNNDLRPFTIGSGCLGPGGSATELPGATVADLLVNNGFGFRMYADGYDDAVTAGPVCASAAGLFPADCDDFEKTTAFSTCNYDPADLPFQYFMQFADKPEFIVDSSAFASDVAGGELPTVAFVKARTYANEHPRWSTLTRGIAFVKHVVDVVEASSYADHTLILLTWDEGGGFFDHVAPPAAIATQYDADGTGQPVPYGTRVPMLALGRFARTGTVSHVTLEHSSIVRFLEHNFLGPKYAGALGHRDAAVANLGSLLDPTKTGIVVP